VMAIDGCFDKLWASLCPSSSGAASAMISYLQSFSRRN
jgi:hypothetical protein